MHHHDASAFMFFVEMEGFEPSSAQGNHTLSTRLFQTSFSSADKTWTTNRHLIL